MARRMPEIGDQLRETRMRSRIDITEVEAATKIRAKYLRALENEEWDLLPGPTFVKTFLRTYADYLGLDARNLVEEYRQRYERPATQELTPFGRPAWAAPRAAPPRRGARSGRGGARRGLSPAARRALPARHAGATRATSRGPGARRDADATRDPRADADAGKKQASAARRAAPTRVRLRIAATGPVSVVPRGRARASALVDA